VGKTKSHFFISVDGVVEWPAKWHFPYFDDRLFLPDEPRTPSSCGVHQPSRAAC
jgi:hypothetical protein